MNDLRCLRCGYELRGLDFTNDWERCPECGRITELSILAADLVARRRRARAAQRDVTIAIAIALTLMLFGLLMIV